MTAIVSEAPKKDNEGSRWPQILAVTIASLASLTNGMLLSWVSPSLVKITQDKETYDITENEASWFTVIPPIVMVITCPIFSKIADVVGRKKVLYLIFIPQVISWTLKALSTDVYLLYLSRAIYGLSDGILYSTVPMYIGEVATPAVRSMWGNLFVLSLYLGCLLTNVLSLKLDIPTLSYVAVIIPIFFACTFIFLPESPYFLLMKKRDDEARVSLEWLMRKDVEDELKQLKEDVDRQMSETGTWRDLVVIKSNRRALFVGIFTRTSQQLTGLTSFNVYTAYIFERSGSNINPNLSAVIYTAICFVLNFVASFTLNYFGTKKSYIGSIILCTLCLGSLSLYFYLDDMVPSVDLSVLRWFPMAGMLSFIVVASFGVSIVPTAILGELFSASIKAKGLSVLILVLGAGQIVSNYLFYYLNASFGFYAPFLFLAVCSFVSIILSFFMIPDTTGKTLEEIQQEFAGNKKIKTAMEQISRFKY